MIKVPSERHPQFIGGNSSDGVHTVHGKPCKVLEF